MDICFCDMKQKKLEALQLNCQALENKLPTLLSYRHFCPLTFPLCNNRTSCVVYLVEVLKHKSQDAIFLLDHSQGLIVCRLHQNIFQNAVLEFQYIILNLMYSCCFSKITANYLICLTFVSISCYFCKICLCFISFKIYQNYLLFACLWLFHKKSAYNL